MVRGFSHLLSLKGRGLGGERGGFISLKRGKEYCLLSSLRLLAIDLNHKRRRRERCSGKRAHSRGRTPLEATSPTLFLLLVLGKAILQLLITSRLSLPRFLAVESTFGTSNH